MNHNRSGWRGAITKPPADIRTLAGLAAASLLILALALPGLQARAAGTFLDDDGSSHEADIEWIASEEITKGCNPPTNDRYCPDDPITRGQLAAFLHRALDGILTPGNPVDFTDDNDSTFEADIAWLAATGVTKGCNPPTNDRYCPDDPVTRAQMASFLRRALGPPSSGGSPTSSSSSIPNTSSTSGPSGSSTSTTSTTLPDIDLTKATWIEVPDGTGPQARHEAGLILSGSDNLFLVGGRGIRKTQRFELGSSDSWSDVGPTQQQFHHYQPVTVDGTIYLMGAMEGNCCFAEIEQPTTNIKTFNPSTGQIETGPVIPPAFRQGAAGAVAHEGWIYLIGGIAGGHGDNDSSVGDPLGETTLNLLKLSRYRPSSDTWQDLGPIPRGRDHFQAAIVGDRIYLVGGRTTQTPFPNFWKEPSQVSPVDVYDISEDEWIAHAIDPLTTPRAGAMVATIEGYIFLIGGEGGTNHDQKGDPAHGRIDVLDTSTYDWTTVPSINPPRHGTGAVLCKNDIYVVSGSKSRGGDMEVDNFQALDLEKDGLACMEP